MAEPGCIQSSTDLYLKMKMQMALILNYNLYFPDIEQENRTNVEQLR